MSLKFGIGLLSSDVRATASHARLADDAGIEIWVEVHGKGTAEPPHMKTIMEACGQPKVGLTWNSNPQDVKDGSVPQLRLVGSSGLEPLYRAALSGIRASIPFPPLPQEFTGEHLVLQFNFLYNIGYGP